MSKRKIIFLILVFAISFLLSGCITIQSSNNANPVDGGVYKSINKGVSWVQKVLVPTTTGKPRNFAGVNITILVMDPSDHNAIYIGAVDNGLIYTYDGAESWQTTNTLPKATVRAIAVSPDNKCTIFAAIGNRVYRSYDCSRNWTQVYFDNELMTTVDALAIDPNNGSVIYIGVARGDVYKSNNLGEEWQRVYQANDRIQNVVIDPNDSKKVYTLTARRGVYQSVDSGNTWTEYKTLNKALNDNKLGTNIKDLVLVKNEIGLMYVVTQDGLMKSSDSGAAWGKIELLTSERNAQINALAVNSKNIEEMYYITNTTFYRSEDGGTSWKTIKLPTTRAGWKLLIDPEATNVIYLGVQGKK